MSQTYQRFINNMVKSRFTPFVFAVIAITLRLGMFLSLGLNQQQYPTSFVWNLLSPIFSNSWISLLASTVCTLLIAFIISQLNLLFNLIRFRTALPFSMLMLFLSIHPTFLPMSPNYISIIFILLAFFPLLQSYQHHSPRNFAFKSGVLLAFAAIFQVYSIIFLLLWIYGEISMHDFRVKSLLALIIGATLVVWNVAGLFFIFDSLDSFIVPFTYFEKVIFSIPIFTLPQWITIGLLILLSSLFLVLNYQVYHRERVLIQKTFSFINLIIICSFILHFLYLDQTLFFVQFIVSVMSFIVANYYSHVKSKWQTYSFVVLLIGLALIYINSITGSSLLLQS